MRQGGFLFLFSEKQMRELFLLKLEAKVCDSYFIGYYCNILILFRHSTTWPEHMIYSTGMNSLNSFQNALSSDFKLCAY